MQRPETSGTASLGVHHVGKVIASCNSIFHLVHQENDVGNDGFIEFTINQETVGCCIAVQIKSGESYVRGEKFVIPSDKSHFDYWRSLNLPVVGIVYDPQSDSARWVDITQFLKRESSKNPASFTIPLPSDNHFDSQHYEEFKRHFLTYRSHYGDDLHFAQALSDFSTLNEEMRCELGVRSLFAFHRSRPPTWYYLISSLRNFRSHQLLRRLIIFISHIPGHPDIFWCAGNNLNEQTRRIAEEYIRTLLTRDDVIMLLEGIDDGGIDRGQVGQCVDSIISIIHDRYIFLESILSDSMIEEKTRYWAALLLVSYLQTRQNARCINALTQSADTFSEDFRDSIDGLLESLRSGNEMYLY